MKEKKADECVAKILDATKDDFPAFLFFCSSSEGDGFVLLTAKEQKDMAKLMADMTGMLLQSPEVYSMIKEVIKNVDIEKGVN